MYVSRGEKSIRVPGFKMEEREKLKSRIIKRLQEREREKKKAVDEKERMIKLSGKL